jgi:excisionase family DNA binding protein
MGYKFVFPYTSVTGAAKYLGISPVTVIMLIKKGDFPSLVQVGTRKMFETHEIDQWKARRDV